MMSSFPSTMFGFDPRQLANIALWLDASDTTTITQVAGAVSQWNDKSGSGNNATQGTGANQPLTATDMINGKNSIKFDGVNDSMAISGLSTSIPAGPNTVFAVALTLNGSTTGVIIEGLSGGSDLWGLGILSGSAFMFNSGSTTRTITANTSAHIFAGRRSGTSLDCIYDGGLTNSANGANVTPTNGFILGRRASDLWWKGDMAEILVYSRALSNAEINRIGNYLGVKWGITWTNL